MEQRNDLLPKIKDIFEKKGVPLKQFILIGRRDEANQDKDVFNDPLGCIINGNVYLGNGTTDPGLYWQQNPMNPKGTAHVVLGYHPLAFHLGTHGGGTVAHEAFIQASPLTVKRYASYAGFMAGVFMLDTGMFEIDFHTVIGSFQKFIGRWSAGCQVMQVAQDLKDCIKYFKGTDQFSRNIDDGKVDYYLFDKGELEI